MLKRQIRYAFRVKGNKVRKKDLKNIFYFATALTSPERDTRIRELDSTFGFLQPVQQDYLRAVYTRSYIRGQEFVEKDVFTNTSRSTYNEIVDRFEDHPQIETPDWDFIANLAAGKEDAFEGLLGSSDQAGYEETFSYYIYENYYIDGSRELEEADVDTPEGLTDDNVYFLSNMAFADGVENKVNELAQTEVQRRAEELMEDKP
jgi:hypothetical protein